MPAPYATYNALRADLQNSLFWVRTAPNTSLVVGLNSTWGGATPSTAVALSSSTSGSETVFSGVNIIGVDHGAGSGASANWSMILMDRLSHQGGLSGTSVATQTTNLPTAALTRYTSGDGVFAMLEDYTAVGSTITTASISYTNQSGTSGRTGQATIGGTSASYGGTGRACLIGLQAGDTGVRSVESVTLAGTTGTAGNFGVTLYRPLAIIPIRFNAFVSNFTHYRAVLTPADLGVMPRVLSGACLGAYAMTNNAGGYAANTIFYAR